MSQASKYSTAPECRERILALIDRSEDPWARHCLQIWLKHWWAEVEYDLDTCLATITKDVVYKWDGSEQLGGRLHESSHDFARSMYGGMFETCQTPGGPFDNERYAFGDWGMIVEGDFTSIMRGSFLNMPDFTADPEKLYLVQWSMTVTVPVDRESGLIAGEIMHVGAPRHAEPSDEAGVARLLGRS